MVWHVVNMRLLSSGGWGELYLGQRSDTLEWVVVKYLRQGAAEGARRFFAREVRILGRGVKGLIPLLGAKVDGDRPYYIMPYMPGGPLRNWIGRLTQNQLKNVALELARAIRGLHAENIAHGDIKPDNTLVSGDGHLHVADPLGNGWGCTVVFSENRGGTPGYWAPEVAKGGSISKAGDVYSFGATLYALVTGTAPRDGQDLAQDIRYHNAPAEVANAIAACCQANPDTRPTMKEAVRILKGEDWTGIRRERGAAAALGFGAAVILLLAAFAP